MPVIAVIRGPLLRTSFRKIPPLGTQKLLTKTRTPTRSASAHCTISGSIPARHRSRALQTSGSLKLALQFRLRSKLLLNRTPRRQLHLLHHHQHQLQPQLQLHRLHRQSHLPRRRQLLPLQHRQLRQLRRYGLLPRPGRSRPGGNAQRRTRVREVAGDVCNRFRTAGPPCRKCFWSAVRPRIAFKRFL